MNNGNFYGQMNYNGQYSTPVNGQVQGQQYSLPRQPPEPRPIYPMQNPVSPLPSIQNPVSGASSGVIWVLGEAEASSYLVAPGCEVSMFDANGTMAYIKSVDPYNRPRLRRFRIEEVHDEGVQLMPEQSPKQDYVTRQEYEGLIEEHNKLYDIMDKMAKRLEGLKHESEPEHE